MWKYLPFLLGSQLTSLILSRNLPKKIVFMLLWHFHRRLSVHVSMRDYFQKLQQFVVTAQPQPQHNKKLGETLKSTKNHHKLKLHERMRIEESLENKNC